MTYRSADYLPRLAMLVAVLLLYSVVSFAQAPGGGATGGPPVPSASAAVPLDGGATLLLASGVAYGVRRLRQRRAA